MGKVSITCLGSCVSRVSLLKGNQGLHGIYQGKENGIKLRYFLDKHNIALAMMPPPFPRETLDTITADELWDKSRLQSMRQAIMKDTIPLLMEPEEGYEAYVVMDFYDFHNSFITYEKTAFSTQAAEFLNTRLFRENSRFFEHVRSLFDLPCFTYYPLVDLFFERIMHKYDSDHIILIRFRSNTHLLQKNGEIVSLPEAVQQHFQSNCKYNSKCRELEDYVIRRYSPYVIDLSKYFMCDENHWPTHIHGAHFEEEFYREVYDQIIQIVMKVSQSKYLDAPRFFNKRREGYAKDAKRELNVSRALSLFETFIKEDNPLALNLLDKLAEKAPEHPRVKDYIDSIKLIRK